MTIDGLWAPFILGPMQRAGSSIGPQGDSRRRMDQWKARSPLMAP